MWTTPARTVNELHVITATVSSFSLNWAPTTGGTAVYKNGLRQVPGTAVTVNGVLQPSAGADFVISGASVVLSPGSGRAGDIFVVDYDHA